MSPSLIAPMIVIIKCPQRKQSQVLLAWRIQAAEKRCNILHSDSKNSGDSSCDNVL